MLARLATTVLAASAANAFLLPPEITESDVKIASAAAPSSAESQVVSVDCPGCSVTIHGPLGTRVIQDKPNHLELTFNIDHQPEGDRLLVNGFELIPNPVPAVLTAPQVPDWKFGHGPFGPGRRGPFGWHHKPKDGEDHHHHGPPNGLPPFLRIDPPALGFAMEASSSVRDPDSQLELVTLDFQIFKVAESFVEGIPELHIKLIKDASGRLMLGNVEQSVPAPKVEDDKPAECKTLLCKWFTAIFPKGPSRPCHRQKHHGGAAENVAAPVGEDARERWEAGMRAEHSWGQLFKNVASHILLPVLIGIIAGVTVSAIGMVVGTVIVALWRTFVRRPSRHHHRHHRRHSSHHHKAPPKEAAVEDEKSGLMENQDLPPAYDAEDVKKADAEV
ncbi:hypothetical protein QBC47DRAFT_144331 [Echria macrotheca]|uniref:DUF7728 domain-containing protein n=1 Tax=Echria macrotheca TaxID=438768 RepID=A0AAJ0BHS3_9PEZI|nr:hypothetical protein QBC47DRAFT_144331 [Echria macrotheca]